MKIVRNIVSDEMIECLDVKEDLASGRRSRQETAHGVSQVQDDLQSGSLSAADLTSKALEERLYTAVSGSLLPRRPQITSMPHTGVITDLSCNIICCSIC